MPGMEIFSVSVSRHIERNIDIISFTRTIANVVKIRLWQIRPPEAILISVYGDIHHFIFRVKLSLRSLAMMHIPVYDQDSLKSCF